MVLPCYFGAWDPANDTPSWSGMQPFEAAPLKSATMYIGWLTPYSAFSGINSLCAQNGAVMYLNIEPWNTWGGGANPSMAAIGSGSYDTWLTQIATGMKNDGHPVLITFAHEMNGSWYPWGSTSVSASQWVTTWKHVYTVIKGVMGSLATMVWCPNNNDVGAVTPYWPGSAFVDLSAADMYINSTGQTFASFNQSTVNEIRGLNGGQPVWNAETGNANPGGYSYTRWVGDMAAAGLYGFTIFNQGSYALSAAQKTEMCNAVNAWNSSAGTGTAPAAPSGLTVTGTTSSSVSLSWTASSGPVTGYYVFRDGAQVATVSGTAATDTGLAPSTTYAYTVKAYNSAGASAASGSVNGTTAASGGGGGGSGTLTVTTVTATQATTSSGVSAASASFSPAAGSMVRVCASWMLPSHPSGVTFTCADSHGNSYTAVGATNTGAATDTYSYHLIFDFTYATAPGATTVAITASSTASADCLIQPYLVSGQAASQSGAGSATSSSSASTSVVQVALTTTQVNSRVFVIGNTGNGTTFTAISGTTTSSNWNDGTLAFNEAAIGTSSAGTSSPGSTTFGWTISPSFAYGYHATALELLPATSSSVTVTAGAAQATGTAVLPSVSKTGVSTTALSVAAVTADNVVAGTSGTASTTHGFTPPTGSLVRVCASWMLATPASGLVFTCNDSLGNSYTAVGATNTAAATDTYSYHLVFDHVYASTPGTVTVTIGASSTISADCLIQPYLVTGQALSQVGAAYNTANVRTSTSVVEVPLTTTQAGSYAFVIGNTNNGTTFTADAATATSSGWVDSRVGNQGATGISAVPTGTPGTTTFGWTISPSYIYGFHATAVELLPALGTSVNIVPGAAMATGAAPAPAVTATVSGPDVNAAPQVAAAAGTAPRATAAGSVPQSVVSFPYKNLGVKVELLLNATWTDITSYVYVRDSIVISPFGRVNEASSMQPAQLTLTLNNRSGRFTPGNSLGAYYPYVDLNTQLRVSVNSVSVSGTSYSGYRFWGEVSSWPGAWDEGARDVYATVTASGIWRRLSQSTRTLGSPYTRYNNITVGGAWTLASYWPMEDGATSTSFANTVPGQAAMTSVFNRMSPASVSPFAGSDALPQLNADELSGVISTSASPSSVLFRFGLLVPSGGDTGVPAGTVARLHAGSATVSYVDVNLGAAGGGPITIAGYNSGGTLIFTGSSTLRTFGVPLEVQVSLVQSGGNVNWGLRTMLPGAVTANTTVTGAITGTVTDPTSVIFSPGATWKGTCVGQAVVIYGNPAITDSAQALGGWLGEYAGARFLRVCGEEGVAAVLVGSATSGTVMGPQTDDTLANMLAVIEATDGGLLFETRNQFGLGYRTAATIMNQSPSLTLDYAAQELFNPLAPVSDDQLVRNDVTLTNYDGYAVRAYLASGKRSILAPPNGAGSGYALTQAVSSASHAQVNAVAQQILNRGTVSDPRYPTVTVKLARTATAPVFNAVPSVSIGDYIQLVNLPSYGGATTQKQLAWGWSETLSSKAWTFTFNTVPEAPWESGFNPGTAVSGQVPGSPVPFDQVNSVSGAQIAANAISLASLAQAVLTFNFGGITSNISAAAPASPVDGSLWFDSGNGYQIKRWDATGGSWVPVTFSGANILGAGTVTAGLLAANAVVAGNIAVGAVTANQLQAGIVVAGIVDSTTITGSNLVLFGNSGEELVYSGPPATGNLIASISPNGGTDAKGNTWGPGMAATQFTMYGNATPATPPAGASTMYASSNGTPSFLSQTGQFGQVSFLRSNVQQFSNSTTTYSNLTVNWPITANDMKVGTAYKIEAFGTATNTASGSCGFQIAGFGIGNQATAQFTGQTSAQSPRYWWAKGTVTINNTGTSGTAWFNLTVIFGDASFTGMSSTVQTINTTSPTTMSIQGTWASGAGGVVTCMASTFERIGS